MTQPAGFARITRPVLVSSLRVTVTAALLASLLVTSSSAGQRTRPEGRQAQPTFRAEVNFVEVDVTVTDRRGNFVHDLTQEDFEVLEDGKPQEVSTFALVDIPFEVRAPLSPLQSRRIEFDVRSNAGTAEGRVFVIALDDLHTHPLRSVRVKEAARQFIEQYVGPDDLVSVIHTSGRSDAAQEFTQHPSLMLASVDRFMGRKLRSATLERLDAYQVMDPERTTHADMRMQHIFDPRDAERGRQAESMLEVLQRVGEVLADARGRRKSVVLISEGVDYDIQNAVAQTDSGLTTFTSMHAQSVRDRMRQAIGALTRANIAVYGIDPRGIATGGDDLMEVFGNFPENPHLGLNPDTFVQEVRQAQDTLRAISEHTGGVASVTSNDFSTVFERILRDNSTYYVLGYHPENTRPDGRFRKIEVRVKRPGLQVRARQGYLAPSSREARASTTVAEAAEASAVLREVLNHPLPVSGLPLRTFAAPFKGSGSNGSVLVGLEVDARNFVFGQEDGLYTNYLEAAVVALDPQGRFLEGDRHSVELRLRPETYQQVQANGMRLLFRLTLPQGRYQLRAAAHEAGSGAVGSVYYDIQVPDFAKEPLSLSGLVLTSTSAAATPTPRPDPDLGAMLRHPPTGSRDFTAAETIGAVFAVYHDASGPGGAADLTTTVTDEDGRVRFRSEAQMSADDLREAVNGYGHLVQIPLADMPPGVYVLRVEAKARNAQGDPVVRELPFSIRATGITAR